MARWYQLVVALDAAGATEIDFELQLAPFELRLKDISIGLRFPSGFLKKMRQTSNGFEEDADANGKPKPFVLELGGLDIRFSGASGVMLEFPRGAPVLSISPVMIADTGVIIEASDAAPYFAPGGVRPHGRRAGVAGPAPPEREDSPSGSGLLPSTVALQDALIGTGGFSGGVITP